MKSLRILTLAMILIAIFWLGRIYQSDLILLLSELERSIFAVLVGITAIILANGVLK